MFEKEGYEWTVKNISVGISMFNPSIEMYCGKAFKDGAEFSYNKAMKEWRDCFMSCSSPYCGDKFRNIQCSGMLGNMTKEVRDGSVE